MGKRLIAGCEETVSFIFSDLSQLIFPCGSYVNSFKMEPQETQGSCSVTAISSNNYKYKILAFLCRHSVSSPPESQILVESMPRTDEFALVVWSDSKDISRGNRKLPRLLWWPTQKEFCTSLSLPNPKSGPQTPTKSLCFTSYKSYNVNVNTAIQDDQFNL